MKKQILVILIAFISATSLAQVSKSKSNPINIENGVALQGYDPVAYFDNQVTKGKIEISTNYKGGTYYFSSEKNQQAFLKNPSHYEPEFGGYCAYGMSEGHQAPVQPEAYTIVNNKLYMNYNLEVKKMWNKEQDERIKKAQINWEKIQNSNKKQ